MPFDFKDQNASGFFFYLTRELGLMITMDDHEDIKKFADAFYLAFTVSLVYGLMVSQKFMSDGRLQLTYSDGSIGHWTYNWEFHKFIETIRD